ncbi:MAG: hypothetical protein ABIP94_23965, partial [Planctomycetota bacterium]
MFGTIAYMAPEQLDSLDPRGDACTDIYQCGLVLYEMLTLRRAFGERDRSSLLAAVRQGRIAPPRQLRPEIPEDLADVCMRAVERLPGQRYATVGAFRDDLERWLAGKLPRAVHRGVAARGWCHVRRFVRTHRSLVWTSCLLSLAAVAWLVLR